MSDVCLKIIITCRKSPSTNAVILPKPKMSNSSTRPDVIMTCAVIFMLTLTISLPIAMCQNNDQSRILDEYKPPDNSPRDDPGHNTHQETVIFACLGASALMIVVVIVLLWYFVDRTKQTILKIERMLPEIIEKLKSDEIEGTVIGHLSGTFDAKGEFEEAGFKGSVDFLDATGDQVKLTSYSKRDETVTTVVAGPQSSGRLTSYTRKINGNLPIDNHTEAASYTAMEQRAIPETHIDGPMSGHAQLTSLSPRDRNKPSEFSVSSGKSRQERMSSGSYSDPFSPSPNDINGYKSPSHISSNSFGYEGFYRRKQRHTQPVIPKDPEKAALYNNGGPMMYSAPPAYDAAYENKALSIDKRATLPITDAPGSKEKLVNGEEDASLKKKRSRSSSYYVESHV